MTRFAFGKNWKSFLKVLSDERIVEAEDSLRNLIGTERVVGATFLDVGSGSGLFSLAAARLGAARVYSFDFDPDSVQCTRALRDRYDNAVDWTVERGSALDDAFLATLGQWSVVYSWGVLHHTGAMWEAIDRVVRLVGPEGILVLAIYNDQGLLSHGWTMVKRAFNANVAGRCLVIAVFVPYFVIRGVVADLLRLRNPLTRYREYRRTRGMSMTHDWMDWLGGYPFEVATPEAVFDFCHSRGFALEKLRTCGGRLGCNEFVFVRRSRTNETARSLRI